MEEYVHVAGHRIKKIDENTYEGENTQIDFCLRKEGKEFVGDIFNSKIRNPDDAFIESNNFSSLEEAVKSSIAYVLDPNKAPQKKAKKFSNK